MKSAGEILKKARLQKGLALDTVAKITKIRPEFLKRIEDGNYELLPGETYIKGFLKNYAQVVGANEQKVLAFFRREYEKPPVKHKRFAWLPIGDRSLTLTPATFLAGLAALFLLGFLIFLAWQYKNFAGSPLLVVFEPTDQQVLSRPFVNIIGKSDKEAQVTINGEPVLLDDIGRFQKTINLKAGTHILTIVATNKLGKETTLIRTVDIKL